MHYFDPANPTDGTQKFAQQAGGVIGMMVPFLLARKTVGLTASKLNIEFTGSMLSTAGEQAATGAFMGLALTPSNDGFSGRLKNAAIDAGTFGVMGAASSKLATKFGPIGELPLSSRIMRSSLFGVASGVPGGFANAELSSIINKGQVASVSDVRDDVASFALFGGLLGGIDALHKGKEVTPPSEMRQRFPTYTKEQLSIGREAVQNELAQVKAAAEDGKPMSVLDKFNNSNLTDAQKNGSSMPWLLSERIMSASGKRTARSIRTRRRIGFTHKASLAGLWIRHG